MNSFKKAVIGAAIVGTTLTGGAIGAMLVNGSATADTTSTTAPASAGTDTRAPHDADFDPTKGGHVGANGVKEELLTGDTAGKVKAAALAAVPGGTVQRVENDAEGATYEAHMLRSDGTPVTVKLDASFKVTATEDGPGHGGRGGHW